MTLRGRLSKRQALTLVIVVVAVSGPAVGLLAPSLSNSVDIQNGVPLSAADGPTVVLPQDTEANLTNPFPASDTVRITTAAGNASVSGGLGNLTFDSLSGEVRIDSVKTNGSTLTVNPEAAPTIDVADGVTSASWQSFGADDGTKDFSYSASSTATVTLHGFAATSNYALVDLNGNRLDLAQSSGSGELTAELPSGSSDVRVQTTDIATPVISDIRPVGRINSLPDTVFANISDGDFPDDTVNVTATIVRSDGATRTLGTDTATSDGEVVSFSLSSSDKSFIGTGRNTLRLVAKDTFGAETSAEKPFDVPSNLTIRTVATPDKLLNGTANVTIYGGPDNNDTVATRTVTDGVINMSELPVTEDFTVSAEADGYQDRTVTLESIYRQRAVYLLSKNTSSVEVRFELEDTTGDWPSDSVLYIERPITRNNSTSFKTVVSDSFGVEGVTTRLEDGVRYQLRIESPSGDTAALGAYTASVSETVVLRPKAPGVQIQAEDSLAYGATLSGGSLAVEYRDPSDATEELTVTIHELGNESNLLRPTQTYYDVENLTLSEPVSENATAWVVKMNGERAGGQVSIRLTTGDRPTDLVPELGGMWKLAAGVFILLVSAGIFSQLNVAVGAVVVALEGGVLWWFGFLNGAATGASVALAIGSAVIFSVASRR